MPQNLSSIMNCLATSRDSAFIVVSVSKGINDLPEPAIFHTTCENILISVLDKLE